MNRPKLPPSPDQLEARLQKRIIVVVLAGLSIGLLLLYVDYNRRLAAMQSGQAPLPRPAPATPAESAEAVRLSAYRAVQAFTETILIEQPVVRVYWRDNLHREDGDLFTFEGQLDVENETGELARYDYTVVVRRIGEREWVPERISVGDKDLDLAPLQ